MIKTEEYMTSPVITAQIGDNLLEVSKKMDHYNIGSMVVMDGDKTVGILTERDILRKIVAQEKNPKQFKAKDVMSKHLQVVQKGATLMEIASLMKAHTMRRIVVMDGSKPAGIVTSRDLIDLLV